MTLMSRFDQLANMTFRSLFRTAPFLITACVLSACATAPEMQTVRMPLEILRAEGEAPRMGEVYLMAGDYKEGSPFSFNVWYRPQGGTLGIPASVSWTVKFLDYCRDRPSWVQSVVIGPSGQVWRGFRVSVPAGPVRSQDWSSGSSRATGPNAFATPGLLEAIISGGRFTLALEDDTGQRWRPVVIDTLDPEARERLFAANMEALAAAPADTPVAGERLLRVVEASAPAKPTSVQTCK